MLLSPQQFHAKLQAPHRLLDTRPLAQLRKGGFDHAEHFPLQGNSAERLHHLSDADHPTLVLAEPTAITELSQALPQGLFLEGGYPSYLAWQDEEFGHAEGLIVLGGKTGAGKTRLLQLLSASGDQVIDLEQIAEHRGSVFGNLEGQSQPSPSTFRHRLFGQWHSRNLSHPLWVEEEGPFIGSVAIPPSWYAVMQQAPFVEIERSFAERLEVIVATYGHYPIEALRAAARKLEERMGRSANHRTLHLLQKGDVRAAFTLLLEYYDSAYEARRAKTRLGPARTMEVDGRSENEVLALLRKTAQELLAP
jgi:tRNA 2-selenouridine synthase